MSNSFVYRHTSEQLTQHNHIRRANLGLICSVIYARPNKATNFVVIY
jgi:hypothetical protein